MKLALLAGMWNGLSSKTQSVTSMICTYGPESVNICLSTYSLFLRKHENHLKLNLCHNKRKHGFCNTEY